MDRSNRRGNNDDEPLVNDDGITEAEIQASRSSEAPLDADEIQVISLESTNERRDDFRLRSHPPPPTSMFGGSFTEPTMEELERHLVRHVEIGPLILPQ